MDKSTETDKPSDLHCVTPISSCPHVESIQPLPDEGLDPKAPCQTCNDTKENWICLHCYEVHCGRFINKHMLEHGTKMKHNITLSFSDLSVWCYACEAYVTNSILEPIIEQIRSKKHG